MHDRGRRVRKKPEGTDLLAIAERTERQGVADADSAAGRYAAAMIRNARAIAGRQMAAGDAPAKAELAALRDLLGADGDLATLNRRLVERIRAGDAPPGTHAHLLRAARDNLAESNPRYLARLDDVAGES